MLQALLLLVQLRIVGLSVPHEPFQSGQVHGVDRLAVVVFHSSREKIAVQTVELSEIETGGVW